MQIGKNKKADTSKLFGEICLEKFDCCFLIQEFYLVAC